MIIIVIFINMANVLCFIQIRIVMLIKWLQQDNGKDNGNYCIV